MTNLERTDKKSLRGEQWKWIPGTRKKYEISNFGRTRLVGEKSQIIKPRLRFRTDASGKTSATTPQVELYFNGGRKMLSISRMVYYLFVRRFDMADRGIMFQYRDGNAHNCDASNLVAVRYNDFVKQGYVTGRRKKNNPFFLQSKKVNQYAMDGQFIATFPSAVEASAKTGIPRPYINRAAWTDKQSAGGYYWRYGKAVKRIRV